MLNSTLTCFSKNYLAHPTILFPLLFLLPLLSLPSNATACKALSFERCTTASDCANTSPGRQSNLPKFICAGRNDDDELLQCPSKDVETCVCFPTSSSKYCNRDSECPDQMYCGRSSRTGNQLCVGCMTLFDDELRQSFTAVQNDSAARSCYKQHPPCGQALDFCSPTMPCNLDQYECIFKNGADRFFCDGESSPCQCELPNEDNRTGQYIKRCTSVDDCVNERETCVYDIRKKSTYCISCDALFNDPLLILPKFNFSLGAIPDSNVTSNPSGVDEVCTQSKKIPRPAPKRYVKSPNGRTFDLCLNDNECSTKRKCVQFQSTELPDPEAVDPCAGPDKLCFCLPPNLPYCKNGQDCFRGESCITSDTIQVQRKCVSNSFILSLSNRDYDLHGRLQSAKNGPAKSGEPCQYDWDCVPRTRCTYASEPARFGGCAGRTACTCRRLSNPECESDGDCKRRERCASFRNKTEQGRPFCVSEEAVTLFRFYKSQFQSGLEFVKDDQKNIKI